MDPCHELLVEVALDDIVGSSLECAHPVDGIGALGGQHDHGNVAIPTPARLAVPEPRAELGLAREDDVGPRPLGDVERLRAPGGLDDVEAVRAQVPLEIAGAIGVGIGEEKGRTHDHQG